MDEQIERRLVNLRGAEGDLARYVQLRPLQDTDETLFDALITRHIKGCCRSSPNDTLLPPLPQMRGTARHVDRAVASQAHHEGLAERFDSVPAEQPVRERMWQPVYVPYCPG